jgi:hypothetical protein
VLRLLAEAEQQEVKDFKTAFSYFFEVPYMLHDEVTNLVSGKLALRCCNVCSVQVAVSPGGSLLRDSSL